MLVNSTPDVIQMIVSHFLIIAMFLLFNYLLGWLPWRIFSTGTKQVSAEKHVGMWLLNVCLIVPIYYLSLLTFSHAVFPFIPAVRGGGDYSVAPSVFLYHKNQQFPAFPHPFILLEETATTLFVAKPKDAGGPCEWRLGPENKPEVLMISREDIAEIKSFSPSNAYRDCSTGCVDELMKTPLAYWGSSTLDSVALTENVENAMSYPPATLR